MKQITINNREYYYVTIETYDGIFTKLYKKETKQRKRFFIFGELINVENTIHQFSFDGDVDNLTTKRKEALKVREQNFYNMINNIKLEI